MSVMIQSMVRLVQRDQQPSPFTPGAIPSSTESPPPYSTVSSSNSTTMSRTSSAKRPRLQQSSTPPPQQQLHTHSRPTQYSHNASPRTLPHFCFNDSYTTTTATVVTRQSFLADVQTQFFCPTLLQDEPSTSSTRNGLLPASAILQSECRTRLRNSEISMLPSFQHTLPTGSEHGDYLALDVGGSTFRVALVRLNGGLVEESCDALPKRDTPQAFATEDEEKEQPNDMSIVCTREFLINETIRQLEGPAFFDWMAERIEDMLRECKKHTTQAVAEPLPMGLAWSFPIEQTSPRSGKLLAMGKGFCATLGIEGQDISALIMRACSARGLPVTLRAIVNDGAATLLAQAYRDPANTRISLICGTGTNAAIFMPVRALAQSKFGNRDASWFAAADHVLVNTEMSMLGGGSHPALPRSRWDDRLNSQHRLPDFQPLEYLTTGRYLGEIVRLIIVDAVASFGLFGGALPSGLENAYTLDTRLIAAFEADQSSAGLDSAIASFLDAHPIRSDSLSDKSSVAAADWIFVRECIEIVTHRAAAYLATALHALWRVRLNSEIETVDKDDRDSIDARVTIACHGTIVERYPGYRARCQQYLDAMCAAEGYSEPGTVLLAIAPESSIFGAAVAVGCLEGWED